MTITLTQVERRFVYNGAVLADPSPSMSVEEVKAIYENQYPDLATATVEGPTKKGEVMEYEFKRKVGTKG
jgi:PRTRC genetic system protein C